jgi:DNA segregation ATPase FtsK/SpoIIIE, S-DNA-T family
MTNSIKITTQNQQSPPMNDEQRKTLASLQLKLIELGLNVKPLPNISVGPLISVYHFTPEGSTKVAQVEAVAEDMSIILGKEVLIKRMPGETSISFAIPNDERTTVKWLDTASEVWKWYVKQVPNEIVTGADIQKPTHTPIPLGFGVDHLGRPFIEDLTQLPHLLIAGTTNSGKSTLIKSLIASIVYTMNSSTVNLVLSDTKAVEFVPFAGLSHLLFPTATSALATLEQMDFLIEETERRLRLFPRHAATNIHEYNSVASEAERLALIVMFIDECADIMDLGKIADQKLGKIVQKSRAAGIHIIAATQRPSAKMIDGTIKANFPARLSFRLPSGVDSRVALNYTGAEHLMMKGDMLYLSPHRPGLHRLHAPLASLVDIKGAVEAAIHR